MIIVHDCKILEVYVLSSISYPVLRYFVHYPNHNEYMIYESIDNKNSSYNIVLTQVMKRGIVSLMHVITNSDYEHDQ